MSTSKLGEAERKRAWKANAPGRYFVDDGCIACNTCVGIAPMHFEMHDDAHSYVLSQPEKNIEESRCKEALRECPVNAIGCDKG